MSEQEHHHSHLHHVDDIADDPPPRFPRSRFADETEMDITPMIDITFLLLIFFLVASHMESQASVPLPPAQYGATVPVKESVIITLDKGEADTARVFKGDGSEPELEIGYKPSRRSKLDAPRIVQIFQCGEISDRVVDNDD